VWQDETRRLEGKLHVMITARKWFGDDPSNLGNAERLRHVQAIINGSPSFAIMCVAVDAKASPRELATFNKDEVFVGGSVRSADGEEWLELVKRIPASSLRTGSTSYP
jgi:hypothetical protein